MGIKILNFFDWEILEGVTFEGLIDAFLWWMEGLLDSLSTKSWSKNFRLGEPGIFLDFLSFCLIFGLKTAIAFKIIFSTLCHQLSKNVKIWQKFIKLLLSFTQTAPTNLKSAKNNYKILFKQPKIIKIREKKKKNAENDVKDARRAQEVIG